jgi:hypothetical protein
MPIATVSDQYERHDLKSLVGAYLMLRPLPYGKKLDRREKAMKMSMETEPENRAQRRGKEPNSGSGDKVDIEFIQRATKQIEFTYCIGEHNLTDANGAPLNFGNPLTLDVLDPKVGTEIEILLETLNGDDLNEEDFTNVPSSLSETKEPEDSNDSAMD